MKMFTVELERDEEADAGLSFNLYRSVELHPMQSPNGKMHQALIIGTGPQPRYAESRQVLPLKYMKVKDIKGKWKDDEIPEIYRVEDGWLMEARPGDVFHMLDITPPKSSVEDVDEPAMVHLAFTWPFGARLTNAKELIEQKSYFEAFDVCEESFVDRDGNVKYAHARPGILIISPNETFTISFFSPVRKQKGVADISFNGEDLIIDNIQLIAPQRYERREEGGLGDAFRKARSKQKQQENLPPPKPLKLNPILKQKGANHSREGATYKPRKGRGGINPYDPRNKVNWREAEDE